MKSRPFTDSDWPAFVAFAHQHFGQSHNTDRAFNEHWFRNRWHDGWAARVLEESDGSIAGVLMLVIVPVRFRNEPSTLAWISSGAVTDAARGRGAGAQLLLWAYQSYPMVAAASGNDFSAPLHDLLGVSAPGLWMRRFIVVHDSRAAELCRPGEGGVVANARVETAAVPGASARWISEIPDDYDALWDRASQSIPCTTDRNASYIAWRYRDAPYLDYRMVEVRAASELRGLAILRMQPTPAGEVCRIVDFVAEDRHAPDVWGAVLPLAAAGGALFTDFMVIGTRQDSALTAAGFREANSATGLNALPHLLSPVEHRAWTNTFHLGGRLLRDARSWLETDSVYFTKGDGDRDWPTTYDLRRLGRIA